MGSSKGGAFERELCRVISLWWTENTRDDIFWRTPGSGAMAKTRSKKSLSTYGAYGDIQATDPSGQPLLQVFTMELKRGYTAHNFTNMLDKLDKSASQMWENFYHQVCTDAMNAKSLSWIIVWRRDRHQTLIYTPMKIIRQIIKSGASQLKVIPHLRGKVSLKDKTTINVFTCLFDDFFNVVKPNHIRSLLK
jgi:hypothetical protein